MIAAVLDLHIGAAARAEAVDQMAGGFGDRHDVVDMTASVSPMKSAQALPCIGCIFLGVADDTRRLRPWRQMSQARSARRSP